MSTLPLLKCTPLYKEKVWGNGRIAGKLKHSLSRDMRLGESWELSDREDSQTVVSDGPFKNANLHALLEEFGERITGITCDALPLLYKFIDANDRLSLQVHPDDGYRPDGNASLRNGKTECWYIVDAEPEAELVMGFTGHMEKEEIARRVTDNTILEVCQKIRVVPGDCIHIPAGTIHAPLGGVLIYEIQQNSDTTFRFFDWGRDLPDRPLHIKESLEVVDPCFREGYRIEPVVIPDKTEGLHRLFRVGCRYFAMEEYRITRPLCVPIVSRRSFQVVTVIEGEGAVWAEEEKTTATKGETILIPFDAQPVRIESSGSARLLVSYVPDLMYDIIEPLRTMGVDDGRITALGGPRAHNYFTRFI